MIVIRQSLVYRWLLFTLLICGSNLYLQSQTSFQDFNPISSHQLDRIEILNGGQTKFHSSLRYNDRVLIYHQLLIADSTWQLIPDNSYLHNEYRDVDLLYNPEAIRPVKSGGFWSNFYKSDDAFFEVLGDDFYLKVNPIVNFGLGLNKDNSNRIFQNTRGIKISGHIDKKVYFYTSIYENQRRFLQHIERNISKNKAIPGQGFFRDYESGIFSSFSGWDYLNAQAYVGFKISPSIDLQLGHGNNFIGHGYNSLLLSDYGNNYFYLKLNTVFWKIHFQNIFTELSTTSGKEIIGNSLLPKKYMAAHYLDFNVNDNFSIGLFEAVIFGRENQFELQYLNPVILYRAVEQFIDSPDNVLLGINTKYNFLNRFQVYGQLMIDELRVSEAFGGNGWWGNKTAVQIGGKYYNAFEVNRLDLQVEYNTARPFTYAHRRSQTTDEFVIGSYSHYNQALAHPLQANFREFIALIKYQPRDHIFVNAKYIRSTYGNDNDGPNIGFDILRDYSNRVNDFNNFTGQGTKTKINLLSLNVSWMIHHNYFIDLQYLHRREDSANDNLDIKTNYLGIGFRVNAFQQNLDY